MAAAKRLRWIAAALVLLALAACGGPAATHNPYLNQERGVGGGGAY